MADAKFPVVRGLIFDLDGTLIDSKVDLIHSVNAMLREMGREELHEDTIAGYIGQGAPQLVGRALGNGATEAEREKALKFSGAASEAARTLVGSLEGDAPFRYLRLREPPYDEEVLRAWAERLRPVLAAFASDIVHTGPAGSAQVAKAANNLILWACLVADHEALALAQRFGLDVEQLRKALGMSSASNDALAKWGTQTMAWAEDDMEIVQQMAADRGLALPQAGLNRELCRLLKPKRFKLDEYGV